MTLQSRFSSNTVVDFEFQRTKPIVNTPTLFVSHVLANFGTAPTAAGYVRIYISDNEGEDLIWQSTAQAKKHLAYAPKLDLPVPIGSKLVLRYANADSVEVTARFLWRV